MVDVMKTGETGSAISCFKHYFKFSHRIVTSTSQPLSTGVESEGNSPEGMYVVDIRTTVSRTPLDSGSKVGKAFLWRQSKSVGSVSTNVHPSFLLRDVY